MTGGVSSEQHLHQADVEPAAELPADLALDTDHFETARAVHRDRRRMIADDAGDQRMKSVQPGLVDESREQLLADAFAAMDGAT